MWRNNPEARRQEVCVAEGAGRATRGRRGPPSRERIDGSKPRGGGTLDIRRWSPWLAFRENAEKTAGVLGSHLLRKGELLLVSISYRCSEYLLKRGVNAYTMEASLLKQDYCYYK